jgi:hypothetical protein
VAVPTTARSASADPALSIHLTPASYSGCGAVLVDTLDCGSIEVLGDSSVVQFAFVLSSGADDVSGAQFGVWYESSVEVTGWADCQSALSIPSDDWPDSGEGIALAFDPVTPTGTDSLVKIGYFAVSSSATGRIAITTDPRTGRAELVFGSGETHELDGMMLGVGSVHGGPGTYAPCSDAPIDPEGDRVLVLVAPGAVNFPGDTDRGTVGQAGFASAAVDSVARYFETLEVVPMFPSFEPSDTAAVARTGETVRLGDLSRSYFFQIAEGRDADSLAHALASDGTIYSAFPDTAVGGPLHVEVLPDDPLFQNGSQWNLRTEGSAGGADPDVDVTTVWFRDTTGDSDVRLAFVDDGFNDGHEEFAGRVDTGASDTGIASDHGYSTASVAAATGDNGVGLAGVDWQATLISVEGGPYSVGHDAVTARRLYGSPISADVSNHSYQLGGTEGIQSHDLRWAYRDAYKMGLVPVVAMGNLSFHYWPAMIDDGMLVVGGSDIDGEYAGFQTGAHIDVSAPGRDVWCARSDGYRVTSGTSLSAPHVAGCATLLLARASDLGITLWNDDVFELIKLSAFDVTEPPASAGFDDYTGFGIISVHLAMNFLADPYTFEQGSVAGGTFETGSEVGPYDLVFVSTEGLEDGRRYEVIRKEDRAAVTFESDFVEPPVVWGRGVPTVGFSDEATEVWQGAEILTVNYGVGWCEPVPGSITSSGCVMRTYVYDVYDPYDTFVATAPAGPSGLEFHYTALGHETTPVHVTATAADEGLLFNLDLVSRPERTGRVHLNVTVAEPDRVTVSVYDVHGREVAVLLDEVLEPGSHDVHWNGRSNRRRVASGLYFVRAKTSAEGVTRRLLFIE